MTPGLLPAPFSVLEGFVDQWSQRSSAARILKRVTSDMNDIQAFYDAITPHVPDIVAHLTSVPYDKTMSLQDRNLLNLSLSLAEIAPAVEWYRQPRVIDGYDITTYRVTREFP